MGDPAHKLPDGRADPFAKQGPIRVLCAVTQPRLRDRLDELYAHYAGSDRKLVYLKDLAAYREALERSKCDVVLVSNDLMGRALVSERGQGRSIPAVVIAQAIDSGQERRRTREKFAAQGALGCVFEDDLNVALFNVLLDAAVAYRRNVALRAGGRQRVTQTIDRIGRVDRMLILQRIGELLKEPNSEEKPFALYIADLSRFNLLDETLGSRGIHALVDRLMARLTGREQGYSGLPGVSVAYLGGGRFGILRQKGRTRLVFEHVRTAVAVPVEVEGESIYATFSVGVTENTRDYACAEDMIRDGIIAAREANEANTDQVFQTSMRIEPAAAFQLEMELRAATSVEDFTLNYQPIVDLQTGRPKGFEALLRWQSEKLGFVSPARFVPIAEDNGLIIPIGRWVIKEAASQLALWEEEFELNCALMVSVNVSAKQLCQRSLVKDVEKALKTSGLNPGCLKIEFTETAMSHDPQTVAEVLTECKKLGVQVWVDDFGTGYSSLMYLQRFPLDGLKLDKSFVDPLDGTEESAAMAKAVLEIARTVGVSVVAEGVENELQAHQLRELGCRLAQGYLFSKPLTVANAYRYIATNT